MTSEIDSYEMEVKAQQEKLGENENKFSDSKNSLLLAKLNLELKRTANENNKLKVGLKEERDARKILETKSLSLVSDIKLSQQKKMTDLINELQLQRSIITKRDERVKEMEEEVGKLREELKRNLDKVENVKYTSGELQQQVAKKFRGSITNMESKLSQNNNDYESRINAMNVNHKEELQALQSVIQRQEEEFDYKLDEQRAEIAELQGRLEESRNSRKTTLEEMRQMRKKYNAVVKTLENKLAELADIKEEEANSASSELLVELEVLKLKQEKLAANLEEFKNNCERKDERIGELDLEVKRLEESLNSAQQEKTNLLQSRNESIKSRKDYDIQLGASLTLQAELEKCQLSYDACKEELIKTKERARAAEVKFYQMEKDFNSVKIDLRISEREKKETERKLTSSQSEVKELIRKLNAIEVEKKEFEKKIANFEKEIERKDLKIKEDGFEMMEMKKILEESEKNLQKLMLDLGSSRDEIGRYKTNLAELELVRKNLVEKDKAIEEKTKLIGDKDRKILQMSTNIAMLKETCNVLEAQLDDFEQVLSTKSAKLKDSMQEKSNLSSALTSLKDQFQNSKSELNEIKSLKLFVEAKLNNVEAESRTLEANSTAEFKKMDETIKELTQLNKDLREKLANVNSNYDEVEIDRSELMRLVENVKRENGGLREECSRTIQELVKLKTSNIQLTEALGTAIDKGQAYKMKMEVALANIETLNEERARTELILQSTLDQHCKLVEHLRIQNDQLSKKKRFAWIFGKESKDDDMCSTPIQLNMTTSAPGTTPRHILKEHNVLQNLEQEALNMKRQLEFLKSSKENINPVKEDLVLLMKDGEGEPVLSEEIGKSPKKISRMPREKKIFVESELFINCITHVCDDIYLMGCDDGLYSVRNEEEERVKILGVHGIYQIELMIEENMGIFVEGPHRHFAQVHLGLLKSCSEAASCSQPSIKIQYIGDIDNCIEFKIKSGIENTLLAVLTISKLNILHFENNKFNLKHCLNVNNVTGICITPNSVLFGSENEKIYELDLKCGTLEDFIDDSDNTLSYVLCKENPIFPLAILDVGLSSLQPGDTTYTSEYLLCFPEVGVFVDAYGRRNRSVNIIWNKLPISVVYTHPYLYILHFGSIEIIKLSYDSYTTLRVGLDKNNLGEETEIIPESKNLQMVKPRLLGVNRGSVIVASGDKETEILEVMW